MNTIAATQRQTKYCQAIETLLASLEHATNTELLVELHKTYPNLSATTVHRVTARLVARGSVVVAPSSRDGSTRYDTNAIPHDHFMCTSCGILRDADVKDKVTLILESSMDDCHISERLTISGLCKNCTEENI